MLRTSAYLLAQSGTEWPLKGLA